MNLSSALSECERSMISVYFSRRPVLPATFESLNDDTLSTILQFVGRRSYKSFGGTSKRCREVYITSGMTKETFLFGYAPLSVIQNRYDDTSVEARGALSKGVVFYNRKDVLDWALEERKTRLLREICKIATAEGKIDLLNEVWNSVNNEDYKRTIFVGVDGHAAEHGKLNVIKWVEDKGLSINEYRCAMEAANRGHLHIIKWLIEEKDLELFGDLYEEAIDGGQLHILKWLREQGVPWYADTFIQTAEEGNLDILQWLHDEGCPWSDAHRVCESRLKPEALDWLRSNGYGGRIFVGW